MFNQEIISTSDLVPQAQVQSDSWWTWQHSAQGPCPFRELISLATSTQSVWVLWVFFVFLGPYTWDMEVTRLGVELEL